MPDAPDDQLARIRADLAYFRKAHATMGGQPPTLYAAKYVEDVEYLLKFVPDAQSVNKPAPAPKTQLELDIEHDEAGRVERKPKRS